ncbi:PIN domain-containing protein [Rhizobium sp. PAMB 3182]
MMYLLDTNIVSELRKFRSGRADKSVVAWIGGRDPRQSFISAITLLELEYGALLMERRDARQGEGLRRWLEETVVSVFNARILPVDEQVARICAGLHIPDRKPERDALIGATAIAAGFTLVTRNVRDFEGMPLNLINPWEVAAE